MADKTNESEGMTLARKAWDDGHEAIAGKAVDASWVAQQAHLAAFERVIATALEARDAEKRAMQKTIDRLHREAEQARQKNVDGLARIAELKGALEEAARGFDACNVLIRNLSGGVSIMIETFAERARAILTKETDNG